MFQPRQGAHIGSRYTLEEELAKGGMGAVWVATDIKLRRAVAVKLLRGDWTQSKDIRRRFEREAMVIAQLACPQIVQIFDYGIEDNVPFIVMEMLKGEDLQKQLKREKKLSIEDASHILWSTAKALGVAHGAGIIHRDLKPGNIFIVRQGEERLVKVLDFGVARTQEAAEEATKGAALMGRPVHRIEVAEGEGTRVGTVIGTPQYMSPEQARGDKNIDHRADLWSLGVIAYRMLTGRLPFRARTANELFVKLVAKDFPPATEVAPELPPEADGFFDRALSPDPDARFPNARELARAFGVLLNVAPPSLRLPFPRAPLSSSGFDSHPSMPGFTPPSGVRSGSSGTFPGLGETPAPISRPAGTDTLQSFASNVDQNTLPTAADGAPSPSSLSHAQLEVDALQRPRHRWGLTVVALLLGAAVAVLLTMQLVGNREAEVDASASPSVPETTSAPEAVDTATAPDVPEEAPAGSAASSEPAEAPPEPSASASAKPRPVVVRPRRQTQPPPPPPPPPEKKRDPFLDRL